MNIPRILSVTPLENYYLLVKFDNRKTKKYNVAPLFSNAMFAPLQNRALFKTVKIEKGGYAISWNNAIDISEYELWKNGELVAL